MKIKETVENYLEKWSNKNFCLSFGQKSITFFRIHKTTF